MNMEKTSKYLEAIEEAGNLRPGNAEEEEQMEFYRGPEAQGVTWKDWSVEWGTVEYPHFALTAADIALYAEHGVLEDDTGIDEYVGSIVLAPAVGSIGRLKEYSHLLQLCEDALARATTDEKLEPWQRGRAREMLSWFQS